MKRNNKPSRVTLSPRQLSGIRGYERRAGWNAGWERGRADMQSYRKTFDDVYLAYCELADPQPEARSAWERICQSEGAPV